MDAQIHIRLQVSVIYRASCSSATLHTATAKMTSKSILGAALVGISSHHAYFIHGDHTITLPPLLIIMICVCSVIIIGLRAFSTVSVSQSVPIIGEHCAAYLAGLWGSILLYRAFFHRLRGFPGPFAARLSQFYHLWCVRRFDRYRWLDGLHKKYGPVVRIGRCQRLFRQL